MNFLGNVMQKSYSKEFHWKETRNTDLIWYSMMFLALCVGIYSRFKGIGKWPLAADEYYIAKSIKNIVASGVPKFHFGGYYTRGLLYQYLAAPFLYFFSSDEFYLRIIPATFNIFTIPPVYWLGKRLAGIHGACVAVIIFSLSLWEIEFSRFARMYAPFQAVYIWYIVFLVKVLIDQDRKSVKWMYFLSALSIFIYEGSVFLIALNFLPIILDRKAGRKLDILISVALLFFAYIFESIDFTHIGTPPPLPADVIVGGSNGGIIYRPLLLFKTLPLNTIWIFASIILFLLNVYSIFKIFKKDGFSLQSKMCLFFLIILSFCNLFGFLILCATIFILLHWLKWEDYKKHVPRIFFFAVAFDIIFWIVYCLTTSVWKQVLFSIPSSTYKKLVSVFLNYPHFVDNVVLPWGRTIPVLSVILFIFLCIGIFVLIRSSYENRTIGELLFTILLILLLITGMFHTPYHRTRYTFFLYPIIILLFVASSKSLFELIIHNSRLSSVIFLIATVFLFFGSDDFQLNHLINIDKKEINYRMNYDVYKTDHFYPRNDVKTPAEIINLNSKPDDIIITCLLPADYYLKRLDYVYCDYIFGRCRNNSACRGNFDRWSQAALIHSEGKLFGLINKSDKTIWIITQSKNYNVREPNPGEIRLYKDYSKYLYYTSIDGALNVYRIPPKKAT